MNIPAIYQYYPSVPLSELSDLYSAGQQTLDGQKICIISHLPKTVRLDDRFPFNNAYILFIENTAQVDSIEWSYTLRNRGENYENSSFLYDRGDGTNRYSIAFREPLFAGGTIPQVDWLQITCKVTKGGREVELTLEHNFAAMLNVQASGFSGPTQTSYFAGNPFVTNYLLNHLKDYLPKNVVAWNNSVVDFDTDSTLSKIVASIIYNNVITSDLPFLPPDDYYDLNEFTNAGLQDLLNDNKAFTGAFTNGICHLPLHILNDAMGGTNTVPDFANIAADNAVYEMILQEPPSQDANGDEYMNTVPQKITASKKRLTDDLPRLKEMFNFSLFPKSAINLTAILIKFLFECSKKNDCKDCKSKFSTWPFLTLSGLKDNQDFLKNTLTHYFNRPANFVPDFATKAVNTTKLVWGPAIYTIVYTAPRITKAYFATRVVRPVDTNERVFYLERIDNNSIRADDAGNALSQQPVFDTALGREIYVVVETLHARGKDVTVNIRPSTAIITGATTAMEVLQGTSFVTQLTTSVGAPAAFNDNNGALGATTASNTYFKIDHADRAIFKITLRPSTRALFDTWTDNLGAITATLELDVKFADDTPAYFGHDVVVLKNQGSFLNASDPYDNTSRFRAVNRIVYEIYHEDNDYNHRIGTGNAVDKLGKIENHFMDALTPQVPAVPARKVCYFYHDQHGNEHFLGEFEIIKTRRWIPQAGAPAVLSTDPNDLVSITDGTQLDEYNRRGVHISLFVNTPDREYIGLETFAALLGAMAVNSVYNLGYNGFSAVNGESIGGSISHINGTAGDLRYIRTQRDGGACLLTDASFDYPYQTLFVESLFYYGWSQALRANGTVIQMLSERFTLNGQTEQLPHTLHFTTPRHNNHLHLQGFLQTTVETINP